jgi:REP element-mobilizing transposase RayT
LKPERRPSPPRNTGVRNLIEDKREWSHSVKQEDLQRGFQGWRERGYLPHRDELGLIQFVTFRLADAFPVELRSEWEALLKTENGRQRRVDLETYLDKGHGACHLRRFDIAKIVQDSLCFRHGEDYELRAWVIMPNHVHLLFKVLDVPMARLMDAWKGYTAKQANKVLNRRGKFWQDGYWDTFMRDEGHEKQSRKYIESKPDWPSQARNGPGAAPASGMVSNVCVYQTDGATKSAAIKD